MSRRAYSFVTLKALDDGARTLEGWATRPSVDRVGDVVEPRGARFRLPLPLLLDHNHESAVGEVFEAKVSDEGIRFKAKIAKVASPGMVKDLCDAAWDMARAGLRKAVSIGFRAIDVEPTRTGLHFKSWDWFELSMCSVPCQPGATIDQIKALDRASRRSQALPVVKLDAPIGGAKLVAARDATPVSKAVLEAAERVKETLDTSKALGGDMALVIASLTAGSKATDDQLAELRARLAKLEKR